MIRIHKYLEAKVAITILNDCNNFSGRIYVEKTYEQCSFNHHHSRRAKKDGWWDIYLSWGLDDEQVYDQDSVKRNYIM